MALQLSVFAAEHPDEAVGYMMDVFKDIGGSINDWGVYRFNEWKFIIEKYGLPIENMKFDFIEVAALEPESKFITREALGVAINSVVVAV